MGNDKTQDDKHREAVALFRYGLIADLADLSRRGLYKKFREKVLPRRLADAGARGLSDGHRGGWWAQQGATCWPGWRKSNAPRTVSAGGVVIAREAECSEAGFVVVVVERRATEAVEVAQQPVVAIQGVEHDGGSVDEVVSKSLDRGLREMSEVVFDVGVGRAEGDPGGLRGLDEELERGELRALAQRLRVDPHGAPVA